MQPDALFGLDGMGDGDGGVSGHSTGCANWLNHYGRAYRAVIQDVHKCTRYSRVQRGWPPNLARETLARAKVDADELADFILAGKTIDEAVQILGIHPDSYYRTRARLRRAGGTPDHILVGPRPWMADRNDRRAVQQRECLSERLDRTLRHDDPAGESRRCDSGDGASDSATRLSVRGATGELSTECLGHGGTNLAVYTDQWLGTVSTRGDADGDCIYQW